MGVQVCGATVEYSMEFLQKIKSETALWPSNSTPGNISEETENTNSKEYMHPYIHCNIIYNSQDLEATQVYINRWMHEKAVVQLHSGILLSSKKEKS